MVRFCYKDRDGVICTVETDSDKYIKEVLEEVRDGQNKDSQEEQG
jgi:hypothetical protein